MTIPWHRLAEPFALDELEFRIARSGEKDGKPWGKCVAYVTARAIQNRLDEVFGVGGWKNEYREGPGGGCVCRIWFKNDDGEWVWKEDGAGDLASNDGLSESDAQKGTFSNALKRAGSALSVGRYLYNLPEQYVNIHANGAHYTRPRTGNAFRWDPPPLPAWALPPKRTAKEREHADLMAFLREAGTRAPASVQATIREKWEDAKQKYAVADALRQAVEASTGEKFQPSPVA